MNEPQPRSQDDSGEFELGATDLDETTYPNMAETAIDPLDACLVPYLDNELTEQEVEQLERRLAAEPELRERLRQLQVSWDMLDEIPKRQSDQALLQSTIEMVVTSSLETPVKRNRWFWVSGIVLVLFLLSLLASFQLVRWRQVRPYQQFVRSLDFLENIEVYDQIQDVPFLESLHDAEVFGDDELRPFEVDPDSSFDVVAKGQSAASPRAGRNETRFEELSDTQILQLQQVWRSFQKSPPESREKLQGMHRQIVAHQDRDDLLATARAYASWLKSIPVQKKYEIAETALPQRVDKVVEVRAAQINENFGRQGATRLPLIDVVPLLKWWTEFVEQEADTALNKINELLQAESTPFEKLSADRRFAYLLNLDRDSAFQLMGPEHLASLGAMLSTGTAQTLGNYGLEEQRRLVERWLQSASIAIRQVPDDTLWVFFKSLPEQERDDLDGLSRDAWKQVLREKYLKNQPSITDETWNLFLNETPPGNQENPTPAGSSKQ